MKKFKTRVLAFLLTTALIFGFAGSARAASLELDEIYTSYGLGQSVFIRGETDLRLLMLILITPEGNAFPTTLTRGQLSEGVVVNIGEDWTLGDYTIRIGYGTIITNEYHFEVVEEPVRHVTSQSANRSDVVTQVALSPSSLEIEAGSSATVQVTAASSVKWETDDTDLITISGDTDAIITAKKTGTATAWAYSGNNYATLRVEIVPAKKPTDTHAEENKPEENKTEENDAAGPESPDAFTDLERTAWAKESINALATAGVVNGIGDGTFAPENNVTRAEFVKMIVAAFGFEHTGEVARFNDVTGDEWYADVVYIAAENNIVNGYDGKFSPMDNISCQDAALILKRVADTKNISLIRPPVMETEAADYAREAVALLKGNKIIDKDMGFSASTNATRAQSAYMIYNIYRLK